MALWSTSTALKRQATIAAKRRAKHSAAAATSLRCRNPVNDRTNASATASARSASNGVTSNAKHDFSHSPEYGWYATSNTAAAAVETANSGYLRHVPVRKI